MTVPLQEMTVEKTGFMWLELTNKCQLECEQCYAESSPEGTHGDMQEAEWLELIDQAAASGVGMIQFIGGEPLLHPSLELLIDRAHGHGVTVEIYSNLVLLPNRYRELLTRPGVQLATSYYSSDPVEHESITKRKRSHAKTTANIAKALSWGVPLRIGLIQTREDQQIAGAVALLLQMGVPSDRIGFDRVREVGRGISKEGASLDQLCGNCGDGKLTVMPDGSVHLCVFSRWMEPIGNVHEQSLDAILEGQELRDRRAMVEEYFAKRGGPRPSRHGAASSSCAPHGDGPCPPDFTCTPQWRSVRDSEAAHQCSPYEACPPIPRCKPHHVVSDGHRAKEIDVISSCMPTTCNPPGPTCMPRWDCRPSR